MALRKRVQSAVKWLTPGLSVKRWLLLLAGGIAVLSLGFSFILRELYPLPSFFYYLTLQFIPRASRGLVFGIGGIGAVVLALLGLNRALLAPFVEPNPSTVLDAVYEYRHRERGPKVVAIGGGHGLSVLLRGLKHHTANITAIVTVADDGGSSGQLRRELGVLPPGDFRNCIAALADDEALITQLFQYRFPINALGKPSTSAPEQSAQRTSHNGHSFGNLFITAMSEVTGSFERAVLESSRVLAVRGRVLPSTLQDVTLMADLVGEEASLDRVTGESQITGLGGSIVRVYLVPDSIPAYPEAVRALLEADLIVAGPGSLYTSILPNLLVPDIAQAIVASRASKVYVCNVATQRGETVGYSVCDHVEALKAHLGIDLFQIVLANSNIGVPFDAPAGVELVEIGESPAGAEYRIIVQDLVDPGHPWRHDSDKLAHALLDLLKNLKS
ncbi:MAG: uridine diphosphate-N-acetylglucosamine-binding protein YvcK [Chloroflexi bacterium]|nr:uridine diphosphate-N-acetylglucosamine-binding protein YvcK [Chloroflexota bacterium]